MASHELGEFALGLLGPARDDFAVSDAMGANLLFELPYELNAIDNSLHVGFGAVVKLPEVDGGRIERIRAPEADDARGVVGVGLENDPGQNISFGAGDSRITAPVALESRNHRHAEQVGQFA